MQFSELNIKDKLKEACNSLGFINPTEIQEKVIPVAIEGKDIIANSPTGTGKTLAYGLPILNNIEGGKYVQVLILAPTRELAMQITNDLKDYSMYLDDINIVTLYGGENIEKQLTLLKKKPQIVVATPGRLKDHLNRGSVRIDKIKTLVLDEADEMLNMGFREDVDEILESVKNESHQTMLFSATFPKEILEICDLYLHDPYKIKLQTKSLTVDTVTQYYIIVKEKDKIEVMSRLIDYNNYTSVMVFCNTKKAVDEVTSSLMQRGYVVEGLHGDMRQMQRDRVMDRFRKGLLEVLVASDVAARGLDIDDIDVVINYDVPDDDEYYIHRIGRTGRAKKEGIAITLVNTNEKFRLRGIIAYTKAKIEKLEVPSLNAVLKVRIRRIIDQAVNETMKDDISTSKSKKIITKTIKDVIIDKSILAEDVISGLILMQMDESQEIDLINDSIESKVKSKGNKVRFFINLGKSHGIKASELKILITSIANLKKDAIKEVEVHDDFSFFETSIDYTKKILKAFERQKFQNKRVIVEVAKKKPTHKHSKNKDTNKNKKRR